MFDLKKYIIVCGHSGCGKTNFSINLSLYLTNRGYKVTIVDLDVVNPYFRSSDYIELFKENNIQLISPVYAGSNLDIRTIDSKIYSVFLDVDRYVIFDVGGDSDGAKLLSEFSQKFSSKNYDMLYIINKYRPMISNVDAAINVLRKIEITSKLKATAIVNNSHLQEYTNVSNILDSIDYAEEISKRTQLPILTTSVSCETQEKIKDIFKVDRYVTPTWVLNQ